MPRRRLVPTKPPVLPPDPSIDDPADMDLLGGDVKETPDEWMARRDEEEGRKHDDNQSRVHAKYDKWMDDTDPNMGAL